MVSIFDSVIFIPSEEDIKQIPTLDSSFLYFPSAFYYYTNRFGKTLPSNNTSGTEEEKRLSLQMLYSMKSDNIFPLKTPYVNVRQDQTDKIVKGLDDTPYQDNLSAISLSMKSQLRQIPENRDWFFYDRFQLLIGQMKRTTINTFLLDFYRFPLHPFANAFEVARILGEYILDGDETFIRKYLKSRNIIHLENHSLNYYPLYELFFLLTRFYSYPISDHQIKLSLIRDNTKFNSPERIFIDSVYPYEIYNIDFIVNIINNIKTKGSTVAGLELGTSFEDWVKWGDEYIFSLEIEPKTISHLLNEVQTTADEMYSWKDLQIIKLAETLKFELPERTDFPSRYSWVQTIASVIRKYNLITLE